MQLSERFGLSRGSQPEAYKAPNKSQTAGSLPWAAKMRTLLKTME